MWAQGPSQDEILGEELSPPLSEEDGLTILGTGPLDIATTLNCHRRLYSYRVTKTDSAGKKCWGQVNVMSCWGRCDSNEIPDFRFPYKKSHHPVCIFGSRKPNVATLDNCDPDVEPGTNRYEYQEAESCHCSVCKSSEASCEGMRYRGVRSGY
ncbi:Glycoprotein hormone beta-5 [Orchesella cincta]|uniref:Glycoprotein hormone beta-5 n=1 Tax=Orchesella cincta TaxID=48709 RepID=A0A1D2NDH7_ORCCI|nr:Glycoprotein hormone beta-5 [Orchesella cincta]